MVHFACLFANSRFGKFNKSGIPGARVSALCVKNRQYSPQITRAHGASAGTWPPHMAGEVRSAPHSAWASCPGRVCAGGSVHTAATPASASQKCVVLPHRTAHRRMAWCARAVLLAHSTWVTDKMLRLPCIWLAPRLQHTVRCCEPHLAACHEWHGPVCRVHRCGTCFSARTQKPEAFARVLVCADKHRWSAPCPHADATADNQMRAKELVRSLFRALLVGQPRCVR